uniref:Basement membrane-specific heparan sulfate proteoglycan core protein n=2 Tax=Mus musculus TaxID=10090 RepID=PGBM_MOUSE|nr:RecName: Full=Basement membrane-specific heparan sulfate proteoglycan core protein; Short=HSPG; Contains: RecName: Full=Endorepellin; Contains: RecName: Full=LG3 peptide; Flags: Precursor [Mus musculus]AAA39911.1 perlecan [Mus musculus]
MGQRAVGSLLLGLLLHARLLAVTHGLRAYDGLSLPEDTETVTASRYGWTYSYLSDDEDLLADDASGDGLGSGDVGSGDFQMVYFRALVNFTRSIEYSPQLEDASAKEFREVSEAVVEKLEPEYRKIPGDQIVSVVFIKELDGWVFVELDVGSEGNADGSQIQEVLHTVVSSGSIGPYVTSPWGFKFRRLGTVPQFPRVCTETEFACHSYNECVALEYRCDRRPDCRDMSDELNCEEPVPELSSSTPAVGKVSPLPLWPEAATTPPPPVTHGPQFLLPSVPGPSACGPQEASCHSGHCIPRDYLCDGQEDCRDGSDELGCASPPPCEPNEFACENGHCALKLWRCDGDFDCEDRTDEANCSVKQPGEVCGPTHFQCVSTNRCIPASFHCDEESDCPDRSDEFGCMPPQVVTPPQQSIQASRGQTVTFTCVATGVPTPIINWRLNWGHIPAHPRVTMTSEGGRGTLIIRDVKEADQGAYTCEAMNSRGMVFGIPDGVLELVPQRGPCPDGHFYLEDSASCLPCFCFGVTNVCQSSLRFRDQIRLSFDQPNDFKGVNVTMPSQPGVPPLSSTQLQIDPALQEFQLVDLSRRFLVHDAFWALPKQFLGNKVDSYGGFLRYKVRYELARGMLEPVQKPDVILVGAGYRLHSRGHTPTHPGTLNQRQVQLSEEHWVHESGRPVQRAEMLQALASLEAVLLQTVYNTKMASVGLSDIVMDTTVTHTTIHGRAHSVEECRCPIGYSGLSCESCDAHFTRVPGGPYLGTCSGCNCNGHASSCDPVYGHCLNCQHNTEGPQCDKCKPGFFGDATKATATACRPCPCPYIDASRRFSDTCFLDTDGQATCDACAPGYTGRRCESCAPGYEGNPIQPGGKCRPTTQEIVRCDERGSLGTSGETCRCKNNVVGRLCNECSDGSFHLSKQNPDGCLKCFCMGVSRQCSSSSWSRAQVLGASEQPSQFSLSNAAGTHTTSEGVSSPAPGELSFSSFHNLLSEPYFWSLPASFRGDKVTSYGGELRFTVMQRPRPSSAPLHRQPLVVLQGNNIVLEHHASRDPSPGQPSNFIVPFQEQAWQRPDGQPATREHLLMALAGIDALLIQASYTQQPAESRLSGISMDVAVPENTGQDSAREVEQCTCPPGYRGPSCQDCDTGYTRVPSGLYLGTCERCNCHGHSETCEPETGACQSCQHHTEGASCEQCQPGYYGDAQRGTPQDCQPCPCYGAPAAGQAAHTCFLDTDGHPTCDSCSPGHSGRHCERCAPGYYGNPSQGQPCHRDGQVPEVLGCGCDPHGSISSQCDAAGQCQCKAQVEGRSCSHCRPHHFHLSASNPEGCLPCFCMGVTQQCASSSYSRQLISTHFAPGDFQGFALVNPQRNSQLTGGFTVEPVHDGARLSFSNFAHLGQESFYWQLPEIYQGDKVAAYGGKLRYTLSYTAGPQGSPLLDPDIQITGNNIMLVASQPALQGPERRSYEIIFREEFWRRPDGQPATREHLLMALADLDELLVRATFSSVPRAASISAVSLEGAQPGPSSGPRALEVEECRCPPGYVGLSCQDCAPGYTRTGSGLYLGQCELCECNGHSDLCHPETGACSRCQHNTAGEFCELCATGYYGDATAGTPEDCQPCACPLTNPENMFSRTCESLGAGGYRCTACEPGYTGQYCEQCAPGYEGDPNVQGGRCQPLTKESLEVQIHPSRSVVPQGGPHSLRCQVSGSPPHYFYWSREDGRPLPSSAQQRHQGSELHFPSVQPSDAGVYICTCRNLIHTSNSRAELLVAEAPSKPIMVTVEEQRSQSVRPGADVTFICTAKSKSPAYTLVWTRLHNGKLPSRAMDFNGILTIRNVQPSDAGTYVCTGSNMFAMDQGTATLHVQVSGTSTAPVASIHPPQLTVQPGQQAEFRCSATGNPTPMLEWIGGPSGQLPAKAQIHNGILRLPAIEPSDQGQYLCRALSSAGQHVARAMLQVHGGSGPRVQVSPERTQVHEGRTVRLYCRAAGVPSASITWRKEGGSLPFRHQAHGSRLRLHHMSVADSGEYVCRANNNIDAQETSIMISVSPSTNSPPAPASPAPIRIESSSSRVAEGQTLDLNCVVPGHAHAQVTWHKRGGSLPTHHQTHGSRLRLYQVSSADSGEYVCSVLSSSGPLEASVLVSITPAAANVHIPGVVPPIRIETSSSRVAEGQTLDLSCVVPGQAHAQVTWHKRGGSLPAGHQVHGHMLRLNRVSPADSGEYSCQVTGSSGTLEASVLVTIEASEPSPIPAPGLAQPVYIESSSSHLTEGQTVDLKCVVPGQAHAQVTWHKRGSSLPARHQTHGSLLRLYQLSPADSGEYVCQVAGSSHPEHEASFKLTVPSSQNSSFRLRSPVISIEPPSSTVQQGQDASFKCLIHEGAMPIKVEWKIRDQELEDNVHISPNGSIITIVAPGPATMEPTACVASNVYGMAQSVVNLSVHGPPTVSVLPEGPVHVKMGKDITLECISSGEPRSSPRWTRLGIPVKLEPRMFGLMNSHAMLKIASVKPSDAGTYVCQAQNALGTAQKQVELIVDTGTVAPGTPQVQVEESELTLEAGHTATLHCSATGNPPPTIHWSKLRAPLPWQHRIEGNTLVIPRVAQQDSGQYICNATNSAGHTEATVVLHVESPPYATIIPEHTSAQPGNLVQLQCLAHGTPPLTYQWSLVGGVLPEKAVVRNQLLRLEPTVPEDSGRYRCQVSNRVGSAEAFAQVLVQGSSSNLPDTSIPGGSTPTVQVTPQLETRNIGASVEFHCAVPNERGTHLRWLKEGGQLPPGHSVQDGVLRIQNLDQNCQGTYVCQAHGPWGQAQATAQLIVQALPSVLINVRTSVHSVVVGHSVEFECLALGDPKPQVTWSKVGGHLRPGIVQSGTIIRIAHVELADAGQYRCAATNAAGTTQSHVLLLVQALPQISTPPEIRVPAGSAAVFPCMASGYPTPAITWSKVDGDLPPDSRLENNMLMLPSVRPEDAGTYVCTATNRQGKVKAFAYLQVPERVIPYFTQTPYSFLPLPTIKDAYRKFEIKITFRPDSADGMLLYNGQKRSPTNLANRQPDFISFGLVGGRPEFRFDAGSGMATIRHPTPLALGQFHTVTLLRSLTQGSLIVGNLAPVNGTSQGKFQGLDLNEELYLGGYPDYGAIPKAGLSSGFVGCVRELRIQGEEIVFHDVNLTTHGISHCPTCQDRPCQNGGQCQDSESSSYTCVCPAGFTAAAVNIRKPCTATPSLWADATCVNRPDGRGYTCRCHLGRSGVRCEEGVTVTTPSMSGAGSYLALPALTNTHHELRLDVEFKPLEPNGILLFSGGKSGPVEDFVSLAMVGGHLEFRYELGSGLAVLRSHEPLALGRWHRVSAERLNKDGSLRVDGGRPVLRSSPGKSQGLNLHTLLYLGGVEPSVQLSPATNMSAHFHGCVGEVSVNGKRLDLTYSFLGSQGVGQCYDSSPCERQPCRNGATCMPAGEYEFQCLCQDGFKGDLCEHEENPCQLHEPCLNGGTCRGARCLCLPGFSGPRCQQGAGYGVVESDWHPEGSGGNDAPGQYGAYFYDNGFLGLPGNSFSRSLPEVPETIEFEVRTSTADGLLLWQGVVREASRSKDFISLGLQDGHLVFSYQLGSGEARLVSGDPINDGEWHRITALREGQRGSIQVDGEDLVTGRSPGPNVAVNTKDIIYIGGAPDVATLTRGKFSSGITGCIKNLVLHTARPGAPPPQPLDLQHRAQAGANTRPCPS